MLVDTTRAFMVIKTNYTEKADTIENNETTRRQLKVH